jgi:hypothetical protein
MYDEAFVVAIPLFSRYLYVYNLSCYEAYKLQQGKVSFDPEIRERKKKGQLAVLSIFCLVYPHSQSFWKWCISHLLKTEEEEDSLKRELSVRV